MYMCSCGPLGGAQRPARRWSGFRGLVGRTGCWDGRTRAPRAAASCSRWMLNGSAEKTSGSMPSSASSAGLTRTPAVDAGTAPGGRGGRDERPLEGGAPLQLALPLRLRLPPLLALARALVPRTRGWSFAAAREGASDAERCGGSSVPTSGLTCGSGGAEPRRSYSASSSLRTSSGSAWNTDMSTCENDGRSTTPVDGAGAGAGAGAFGFGFGSGCAITSSLEGARAFGAGPVLAFAPVEFGSRRNGRRAWPDVGAHGVRASSFWIWIEIPLSSCGAMSSARSKRQLTFPITRGSLVARPSESASAHCLLYVKQRPCPINYYQNPNT
jgi:hypothetical protein